MGGYAYFQGTTEDVIKAGRPKLSWLENIKNNLQELKVRKERKMANNTK
jgi:hypothetical protein